jgi:hypothetical protein
MPAEGAAAGGKCAICGRPTENDYRPFCSRRCADVDLARWLRGAYVIPDEADGEKEGSVEGSDPAGSDPKGVGNRE